jgi:energy-coupling factor transporter ATP-binding protein EcfA2
MHIHENANPLQIKKQDMECDKLIKDSRGRTVMHPLMKSSHLYLIIGPSGSGKTNLVLSLLKNKNKTNGERHAYHKCFDSIIVVSPSMHTISDNIFESLPDNQKFEHLNDKLFTTIDELTENNIEDNKHTLLILDDVSSELRRNKDLTKKLNILCKNRRHKALSLWIIGHKLTDIEPQIRNNASLLFIFKPKNNKEIKLMKEEYFNYSNESIQKILDYIYQSKHDFMIIDTSLRNPQGNYDIYRNFNKLDINEHNE